VPAFVVFSGVLPAFAARVLQAIEIRFLILPVGLLVASSFLDLQDRVFLQLLLNAFFQCQDRQLQDFHRLDHAGSQDHPLRYLLVDVQVESHRR
jgi:hypothetical protein